MGALVSDPLVGRTIDGRYDVRARIARGGMATVYLATDRRLDRAVALKVMHPHLADGTDVVARFRREARAAARLAHPGIVAVLDQGIDGETSYLVMEYVPGRTLRTEIAGQGALRLGDALRITEGVLDALAAAHRAGLVHRDIKPENVLVHEGRVKVGDFGLARAVTEATAASTGTLLGTVAYLSPEIVSSGDADARADVYATGVMLYEMITGTTPFSGATPIQVAYQHVHSQVPAPSESVPWMPMDVDDLVAALTARDPHDRPIDGAAALALVRHTRRHLGDRAMTLRADVSGRPELLVPVRDLTQEYSEDWVDEGEDSPSEQETFALDLGPGTGTIALPIGAIEPAATPTQAPVQTGPAPRPRRRTARAWLLSLLLLVLLGGGATAWWFLLGPGSPVTVPSVVGMSSEDAVTALEKADLVAAEPVGAYSDDVPSEEVLSVLPEAGTTLARNTTVTLTVSLGIEHLTVPTLVGSTQEQAEADLETAGLGLGEVTTRADRTVPEGTVLEASAEAAASIPHNELVNLVVSSGPLRVTIPGEEDYLGKDRDVVVSDLADLLDITPNEITVTEAYSDDVPEGAVISVTPAPGTADVPQGTPAAVVVSKGPELIEVPNVERLTLDHATEKLEGLGFEVASKPSWGGVIGQVVDQVPAAGEQARRGSTITLTYI